MTYAAFRLHFSTGRDLVVVAQNDAAVFDDIESASEAAFSERKRWRGYSWHEATHPADAGTAG